MTVAWFLLPMKRPISGKDIEVCLRARYMATERARLMVRVLREEYAQAPFTGVIHCFTAGPGLATAALELGFYISLAGVVTFKKAEALRETVRQVPLERLLVETDAPYLAPVPKRGKRNEPAFVVHTAEKLAEIKGIAAEDLARATTENFHRLFAKAAA